MEAHGYRTQVAVRNFEKTKYADSTMLGFPDLTLFQVAKFQSNHIALGKQFTVDGRDLSIRWFCDYILSTQPPQGDTCFTTFGMTLTPESRNDPNTHG